MTRTSLFALILSTLPAVAEEGVLLPSGFDGPYAAEGMACDGLGRIEVRDGVMVGAEFAITVTDLVEVPGEARKVEVTLLNQGGGGEWTDSAMLSLAEDGRSLTFAYPDGTESRWLRCD